jgi:hypothetical protein
MPGLNLPELASRLSSAGRAKGEKTLRQQPTQFNFRKQKHHSLSRDFSTVPHLCLTAVLSDRTYHFRLYPAKMWSRPIQFASTHEEQDSGSIHFTADRTLGLEARSGL